MGLEKAIQLETFPQITKLLELSKNQTWGWDGEAG